MAKACLDAFLAAQFTGASRPVRRVEKLIQNPAGRLTHEFHCPDAADADPLHRFWHDSLEDADPGSPRSSAASSAASATGSTLSRARTSPARRCSRATGSVFTNKYAEGYLGRRYYGGCEWADEVGTLARSSSAKKLFGWRVEPMCSPIRAAR